MRTIGSAFFLLQACCVLALAASNDGDDLEEMPLIRGEPIISARARAARIAEFVSSHKIPDDIQRKDARLLERRQDHIDDDEDEDEEDDRPQQRRTHIDLENFGSTGLLYEDHRRNSGQHVRQYAGRQEELLSGVRLSSENPTTMLPILTTQRDTRPFDFVPVNIIREDGKGGASFLPFDNKNFEDLGDVNLVPAGSNTRIQVKKGPNGKDYEYEYVYYYYDEEDEGKASGTSVSVPQETPTRTQTATNSQRQRGSASNSNRNKYSTVDRGNVGSSSTVEPVINEVIPSAATSGNGNRARQLESHRHEEVAEERLPTNTRFPPRARSNQATAVEPQPTERSSRGRGNRQRSSTAEPIDSSNFRGHPEGPEFPQNLPNGPVRFLGVTPNEGNEEKTTTARGRVRPSRIQEPAPVQEAYDEPVYTRKRPVSGHHESQDRPERVQQSQFRQQPYLPRDEEFGTAAPSYLSNSSPRSSLHEDRESYTDYATDVTDAPTTQVPSAMQKVALDLYAFLQQGRSNLVDFVKEADDDDSTESSAADNLTTEIPLTTSYDDDVTSALPTTTPTTTTTTTTTTSSTTTSTTIPPAPSSTEEPSTPGFGRTKFRRPGIGGPAISRNRFKSASTESSAEASSAASPTQRARGRFGASNSASPAASGNAGFKRARPSIQKHQPAVEEPAAQKESAEKANAEATKPAAGRGRYRGTSARSGAAQIAKTTAAPAAAPEKSTPSSPAPANGVHRPAALNKLAGINRRRGSRPAAPTPVTAAAAATDDAGAAAEQTASSATPVQENVEPQKTSPKIAIGGARAKPSLAKPIIKPAAGRLNNLRPRLGAGPTSTTTTETPADAAPAEAAVEEPASEGTEEETRRTAAETSPATKPTTTNPLNKLRNRNRIQVHPKTTTARTTISPAARRSPLLPRRKTTEAPIEADPVTEAEASQDEASADSTESQPAETSPSTAAPAKHEESRGLSSLLAPRRRIAPRRPGQPIVPSSSD